MAAAAAAVIDGAPKKVSTGSGQADFLVEQGPEGRDDAPYSDISRSTHYERVLSSPLSLKGDKATFSSHRSKGGCHVGTESASIPSIRRSKTSESSLSIKTDYGNGSNDIINLGMEFELGLGGSVARRQPKRKESKTNTTAQSSVGRFDDMPSANSLAGNNTGDDVVEAPKQSDVSVMSDANSRNSLRHIFSRNKEAHSPKSHGMVVSTTTPLETIQIQHNSTAIRNNHSSKKDPMPSSNQRKQLQRSELEYWSGLSVRAAMAVMQANGSEKMAQKASNIILDEARRQSGRERSGKMMRALSTKLSVALLEAGCDPNVASAAVLGVMTYENNYNGVKSAESMLFDDSSSILTNPNARDNEIGSIAPSLASTIQSNPSEEVVSITPSIASKQRKLKTIEKQIAEKQRAIEEAELRNQEKEREFNKRIEALKSAANEKLTALDTEASLLEKAGASQAGRQDVIANESRNVTQEDDGKDVKRVFQNGADDFVLWWC